MNSTLKQSVVDRALERDHAAASAEFLAQFRSDIESFISLEAVQSCVEHGVYERAPTNGVQYFSFTDGAGGSGGDSAVCAVGHMDGDVLVVDAIRERRSPFDPDTFTDEAAQLLALYKITKTVGDRYSANWIVGSFDKRGLTYEGSEQNKSELYLEMLPRINAKTIRLLDNARLINQAANLERRTSRAGKDQISHPTNQKDDVVNCVAGLCGLASTRSTYDSSLAWVGGPTIESDSNKQNFRSIWQHPDLAGHFYGF
jgi:hypothetical protein